MNFKHRLAELLATSTIKLDIRTDQCDVVRVMYGNILVGIEELQGRYRAQFTGFTRDNHITDDRVTFRSIDTNTIEDMSSAIVVAIQEIARTWPDFQHRSDPI